MTGMVNNMASDEVTDAIAHIEMHRQETVKEEGVAAACQQALRKLQELLEIERQALLPDALRAGSQTDVDAVMHEINRVKSLAGNANRNNGNSNRRPRPGQSQNFPRRDGTHNPGRNKGRRTMGRRGDR
jgi:bacterioferritin-associated ferredoxin